MIEVFSYTFEKNEYNPNYPYNIQNKKGDSVVSHGTNIYTGKAVTLPCDPFGPFVRENCYNKNGTWYLNEYGENNGTN